MKIFSAFIQIITLLSILLLPACSYDDDYPNILPLDMKNVIEVKVFGTSERIASLEETKKIVKAINSVKKFEKIEYQYELAPPESEIIIYYGKTNLHIISWEDSLLFNYQFIFNDGDIFGILLE